LISSFSINCVTPAEMEMDLGCVGFIWQVHKWSAGNQDGRGSDPTSILIDFDQNKRRSYQGGKSHACRPGLPDFSWYNIPKQGKIYQITTKLQIGPKIHITNGRNIFQMVIKCTNTFHSKALQNLPKLE
jgi:hypothetical protein